MPTGSACRVDRAQYEAETGERRERMEFEGCENAGVPEGIECPEGIGPAPDHTYAGPETGVPSSGIQRLAL